MLRCGATGILVLLGWARIVLLQLKPPTVLEFVLGLVLHCPLTVIMIRDETNAGHSSAERFNGLLSAKEIRNPWKLYFPPGFFLTLFTRDVLMLSFTGLREMVIQKFPSDGSWYTLGGLGLLMLEFATFLPITAILSPLEVILIRLATRQYHEQEVDDPSSIDEAAILEDADDFERGLEGRRGLHFGGAMDVIDIRTEQEPYKGPFDCARQILKEEGRGTFWRGWFAAAVFYFLVEFSPIYKLKFIFPWKK